MSHYLIPIILGVIVALWIILRVCSWALRTQCHHKYAWLQFNDIIDFRCIHCYKKWEPK